MDNTLIIYITGDNGSSGNGGPGGMFNTMWAYNQKQETLEDQLKHLNDFGGPHSDMTPPLGWAVADDTPFAYCQFFATYGGTTNGAVFHWPKVIKARKEIRPQYAHLIDVAPTILEAAGLPEPKTVNGITQKPLEGASMVSTFADPKAKSRHSVQYYEFVGNRGIYKDGWYAVTTHLLPWDPHPLATFENDKWELYNTDEDFSCAIDLAAKYPDKLKEMQALFLTEAVKYNVLPLDDRAYERMNPAIAGRPDIMAGRTSLTLYEGMVSMPENAFINTKNHSYSIAADVEIPEKGVEGVILAQGGVHAGFSLYVKGNKPKFAYNYLGDLTTIASPEPLPAGRVRLVYDFAYDGGKPGSGGTGTISVNGKKVASGRIESTIPYLFGVETADVGMDLYHPVTSDYARGKNKFTGKINKVNLDLKAGTSSKAVATKSKAAATTK
jgi:arylsulfatase